MLGARTRRRTHSGYLRTTFDAQGANLVHPHVTDVHALGVDLDGAALEVLLLVHVHLRSEENHESSVQGRAPPPRTVQGRARGQHERRTL